MSERTRVVIDYIVACVNDFADVHRMSPTCSFTYLKTRGGIDFLERNYEIEHTYSIEEAVEDMAQVCRRNGGDI